MKKILMSLFTIAIVGALITGGTIAYFSDVEQVGQNVFTAGTLDLKVNDRDNPIESITLSNMKPGDEEEVEFLLKNVGTIKDVKATMHIDVIQNLENGCNEPEALVDSTTGDLEGELGGVLMTKIYFNGGFVTQGYLDYLDCNDIPLWPWQKDWASNQVKLTFSIDSSVGNIIQSDSVEFEIIFHLDQA